MMNEFSHLRTVVGMLVALALSNLATSIHHLLRERHRVRWDWLAPCTALIATLLILHFWFNYYDFGRRAALLSRLGPVLLLLLELLQVVLLVFLQIQATSNQQLVLVKVHVLVLHQSLLESHSYSQHS